jgi:hypothetical protein
VSISSLISSLGKDLEIEIDDLRGQEFPFLPPAASPDRESH